MNPHNNQIQQLIAEIDAMLEPEVWQSASAWKKNTRKSQKLLKRVRNFLASVGLQNLEADATRESKRQVQKSENLQIAPILAQLVEPWQEEIENLQQQRQELLQEVRELERQRQYNYSLAQQYTKQQQIISEFSQALLVPVQDRIIEYLESIANLQDRKPSPIVPGEVSEKDEPLFPDRRMERMGEEEIKEQENAFGRERESGDRPQHLQMPSRDVTSARQGHGLKLPPDGEIFPYPGYEWFDRLQEEKEVEEEEKVEEKKEEESSELNETFLQLTAEEEEEEVESSELNETFLQLIAEEEDEEVESSELNETFLQLIEEEEEVEEDEEEESSELNETFLQIIAEEEEVEEDEVVESSELNETFLQIIAEEEDEEEVEEEEEVESSALKETSKENIEELSEIFGELSQAEEERGQTIEITEKETQTSTKEANKQSAIARVEKEPFIAASADESLLPTQERIEEEKDLELLLNEKTIEELATDLAQLEEANLEDEANYLEDYDWENTVIQTDRENPEVEPSFPREFLGKAEEEESENALVLEVSSEGEEDVASFEDFLANISDFSKQASSQEVGEEEEVSLEVSEERTLEDILTSLTSGDETPPEDREDDDDDERIMIELLELEDKMKEDRKMSSN